MNGKLNDIRAQIREMKSIRLLSTTLDAPIPSTCLAMCCMPIMLPSNGSTVRIPTILCCMFFFASIHRCLIPHGDTSPRNQPCNTRRWCMRMQYRYLCGDRPWVKSTIFHYPPTHPPDINHATALFSSLEEFIDIWRDQLCERQELRVSRTKTA